MESLMIKGYNKATGLILFPECVGGKKMLIIAYWLFWLEAQGAL